MFTSINLNDVLNDVKYSAPEEIKQHQKNIQYLFDLNFGKDWRYYIKTYYGSIKQRHLISGLKEPSVYEEDKFYFEEKVDIYIKAGFKLLKNYLINGKEHTIEQIEDDLFRFIWYEEIVVSSNIYYSSRSKQKPLRIQSVITQINAIVKKAYTRNEDGKYCIPRPRYRLTEQEQNKLRELMIEFCKWREAPFYEFPWGEVWINEKVFSKNNWDVETLREGGKHINFALTWTKGE